MPDADDLRGYGHLPGNYTNFCADCREQFQGAKRSWRCVECATRKKKRDTETARPKCFGLYRSPQSDAENDCDSCKHDLACDEIVKRNRATGVDRGRS